MKIRLTLNLLVTGLFQLLICSKKPNSFGFVISGFSSSSNYKCWKNCSNWCQDGTSPSYFSSNFGPGVFYSLEEDVFNTRFGSSFGSNLQSNGTSSLVSVGIRRKKTCPPAHYAVGIINDTILCSCPFTNLSRVEFFWRFESKSEYSPPIPVRWISHSGTNSHFLIKCSSTLGLYVGQPFTFSGALFGGIVPNAEYTIQNILSKSTFAVSVGQTDATTFPGAVTDLPAVPQLVVFAVKSASEFLFICQSTAGLRSYMPIKFLSSTFVTGITVNTVVYYIKGVIDDKTFSLFQPTTSGALLSASISSVGVSTNNGNCDIFYFNNGATCKKAVVVVPYAGQINIASVDSATSTLFASAYLEAVIGLPISFQPNFAILSPLSRGLFVVGSIRPEDVYYISSSSSRKITVTGAKLTSVYVSTASHLTECQKIRFSSAFGSLPVAALTTDYFVKKILHDGAIEIASSSCAGATLQVDSAAAGLSISSSWPLIYAVDAYSQSFDLYSSYQISAKRSSTIPPMHSNSFVVSRRQNNFLELDSATSPSGIIQGLKIGSPVMFFGPLMWGISKFGKYRIDAQFQTNPDAFTIQFDTGKGVLVTSYSSDVFTCASTFDFRSGDVVYFAGTSFATSISVIPGDMYVIQAILSPTTFQLLPRDPACTSGVYTGTCMRMSGPALVQSSTGTASASEALYMRRAAKLSFVGLDVSACTTNEISCLRQTPERVDAATMFCAEVLTVGAKVRFSGTPFANGKLLGGLIPSTDYYISSKINGSAFTVSASVGNSIYSPFVLTPTAFSRCIVTSVSLTNLKCEATATVTSRDARGVFTSSTTLESFTVGQQVIFTAATFFGGIYGSSIYTIRSIEGSLKFTVSGTEEGNAINDGTTSSGTMTMTANPLKIPKFSVGSRVRLFARERIAFAAVSGFAPSTTYYITKISKTTNVFSISSTVGGTDISAASPATPGWIMMTWQDTTMSLESTDSTTDSSSKMNVRFGTSSIVGNFDASIGSMSITPKTPDINFNKETKTFGRSDLTRVVSCTNTLITFESGASFDVGESMIFTGGFGNIVAAMPYFIKSVSVSSISSANVIVELSTDPRSAVLAAAAGSLSPTDVFAYSTNLQYSVQCTTSSASTYSLTCSSLSAFAVSEAVVFASNTDFSLTIMGNIDAGSLYFVRKIISNSHVVLSTSANGPALSLTDATGSITMTKASARTFTIASCTSTTLICSTIRCALFLNVSSPIVFEKTVICGIVAGQTYFVHSVIGPTEFSIATFIGSGSPFPLTVVASGGTMPFYLSTGVIQQDLSNFQRHLVPSDRNSQVRITNQRPLSAPGCSACKTSQASLMCGPRSKRSSKNGLETVTSNSTVSVGDLTEFTLEASFLFYDCSSPANREQTVFGRDGMKIKVSLFCLVTFEWSARISF